MCVQRRGVPRRLWEDTNERLEEGQISKYKARPAVFESVLYLLSI